MIVHFKSRALCSAFFVTDIVYSSFNMEHEGEILFVDKPVGITSFDVIRRLRRKLEIKKMGHAGTLDPRASGLMIIGVRKGTKRLSDYIKLDKEYVADILVGERRDTGDLEGVVIESKDVSPQDADRLSKTRVIAELEDMEGELTLPVSVYSAIKKDGVPLYKRARRAEAGRGEMPENPMRTMRVYEAELLERTYDEDEKRLIFRVRFYVGSGTYIRSLAEELGKRLGYPATLAALRRTRIGENTLDDAIQIENA